MRQLFLLGLLSASLFLLSACGVRSIGRYPMSADNIRAIETHLGPRTGRSVSVGPFTSFEPGFSQIWCRINSPLTTPDGSPFAEYIRSALIEELRTGDALSENGTLTLQGHLESLELDSWNGKWELTLTITSNAGAPFAVSESHEFTASWYAESACDRSALEFVLAVQRLIYQIVNHPTLTGRARPASF